MLPNVVLFEGEDSSGHPQLWQTNGTAAGTIELAGILGISATGLGPVDLTPYDVSPTIRLGRSRRRQRKTRSHCRP